MSTKITTGFKAGKPFVKIGREKRIGGTPAWRNRNPGNLRSVKGPFTIFETDQAGWNALLDYLTRAATGKHKAYKPDFTLLQFFKVYAPSADKNDPDTYAKYVAKRLSVSINEKIKNLV